MKEKVIKISLLFFLALLFSGIAFLFWQHELVYNLPTPVPVNYQTVSEGTYIDLNGKIPRESNKPVFLHFFNLDCPCSRFNLRHFKSLVNQYGDKINFMVVMMKNEAEYTATEIQQKTGLQIPVLFDTTIAVQCGVYSTPQAVILDRNHKLYYRGNYNKTRYCADKNSNFAQMAIDSLLNKSTRPNFNKLATTAYGCKLPNCSYKYEK